MDTKVTKLVGLFIGCVGAAGQAWLLCHDLVDSYPYKIMSSPPAEYYARTGLAAFYLAPTIAFVVAAALSLQRAWAGWIVPVVICPAVYAMIFLVRDFSWNGPVARNFDGTTPSEVTIGFLTYAVGLSVAGAFVGFTAFAIWSRLTDRSELS